MQYAKKLGKQEKPKTIKEFKLGKMIGSGAFGTVYEGMDVLNGRQIAVKKVPRSMIGSNVAS